MNCNNCKGRLCKNFILSQTVTFDGTNLVVNLPARNYSDGCTYCIVIAQTIPDTATINAPVVFTIGTDTTTLYPFVNRCCEPILATQVGTRDIYKSVVSTSIASGVFKYIGDCKLPRTGNINAESLPIEATTVTPTPTPTTPAGGGA